MLTDLSIVSIVVLVAVVPSQQPAWLRAVVGAILLVTGMTAVWMSERE
jgi:hypothetical protein